MSSDFKILPVGPHPLNDEELPPQETGPWIACFIVSCVVLSVIFLGVIHGISVDFPDSHLPSDDDALPWALWAGGVSAIALTVVVRGKTRRSDIHKVKEARAVAAKRQAEDATGNALELLVDSERCAHTLPGALDSARQWLRKAKEEYADSAFGPFWDAVEVSAEHLDLYNRNVQELATSSRRYYEQLNGRQHTFPSFPVTILELPDATPVVEDLQQTVRMGQTNFQFALIWEQRKTRQVLLAGFRTLGEAIGNLGDVVESSVSNLRSAISSDLARIVEEQIRTRESIGEHAATQSDALTRSNEMLDNIQRRRKSTL